MKKITLLMFFFVAGISFSQQQQYHLDFEDGTPSGLAATWNNSFGGTSPVEIVTNPNPSGTNTSATTKVLKTTLASPTTAEDWAGIDNSLSGESFGTWKIDFNATPSNLSFSMDVHKNYVGTIGIKMATTTNGTTFEIVDQHVDNAVVGEWQTLTWDLSGINPNGDLTNISDVIIFIDRSPKATRTSPATYELYVDNIKFYAEKLTDPSTPSNGSPSTAAPTPPARTSTDVISLFSDAYTDINIKTLPESWSQHGAFDNNFMADGNATWKIGPGNNFLGMTLSDAGEDVSGMDKLHIDYWTEDNIALGLKLVSPGGAEKLVDFPATQTGSWQSIDINLSDFTGVDLTKVIQLLIDPASANTMFVDNLYFYKSTGGGNSTGGDIASWTFDDASSTSVFTKIADAASDANAEINYNANGNGTGALELVGVNVAGGAGKNYSFRYENATMDFKNNAEFKISFDAKFVGTYAGAAFHIGVQVPNTTAGSGVKQINIFDKQGEINGSTWSTIEATISDTDFDGSSGLFILDFQIAAGADANAGGTVLIDNLSLSSTASVENNELLGFRMYPNPANNMLNISANEIINNADIFNVLGKRVMSVTINKTNDAINVSDLASGIYLIKYTVNDKVGTAKFIKQ